MIQGCDYVSGPAPDELRRAGLRFVCRYVSTPGNPKNLTRAEHDGLRRHGIATVLVFETTARRALGGLEAGHLDALSARRQAHELGWRRPVIYFAVDFDTSPLAAGDMAHVVDYIRGAAEVLGHNRTGVYGGLRTVTACHAAKACRYLWQTRAWSGVPAPTWHPARHLEQYGGGQIGGHAVDYDRAVRRSFGAWRPWRSAWWWGRALRVL